MKKDLFEDEEVGSEANSVKKGRNKKVIVLVGILSTILIIAAVFGVSYLNRVKAIEQADALIAIERYEDGITIYDNLLSKKYSQTLMNKRNIAVEAKESEENLKNGLRLSEEGDINKAVKLLSKISRDDEKRYGLAVEELTNIEEMILIDVYQLIEDGDLDEASQILNNYLKVDPKNVKMQNVKESINAKKSEEEKKAQIKEKDKEEAKVVAAQQAELNAININKNTEVANIANNIIGTYRSTVSGKANLRDAPTLNSSIVSVLHRGTEVYIHDTQVESTERIWCYISTQRNGYTKYGWISYNTMNYNIQ